MTENSISPLQGYRKPRYSNYNNGIPSGLYKFYQIFRTLRLGSCLHETFATISALIKVAQWYVVQVSDTTMLPYKTNACPTKIPVIKSPGCKIDFSYRRNDKVLPLKILMKIRYRFYPLIKISKVKFFVRAVQVITV